MSNANYRASDEHEFVYRSDDQCIARAVQIVQADDESIVNEGMRELKRRRAEFPFLATVRDGTLWDLEIGLDRSGRFFRPIRDRWSKIIKVEHLSVKDADMLIRRHLASKALRNKSLGKRGIPGTVEGRSS